MTQYQEAPTKRKLSGKEVQLYDGTVVVVRELRPKDVKLVLTAMPALKKIGDAFGQMGGQVSGLPVDLPDDLLESAYPLLVACTGLSDEELRNNYSMGELLIFLNTFNELLVGNFQVGGIAVPAAVSPANSNGSPSA